MSDSVTTDEVVGAVVETFDRAQIVGWVAMHNGSPPVRVGLHVDGAEVASTWAVDQVERHTDGDARQFRFPLSDLWQFVAPANRLSVRVAGRPVPIAGAGLFSVPATAGSETVGELQRRLAGGEVFTTGGRLRLSKTLDSEWQTAVLDLYGNLRRTLHEKRGHDLFFVYGTLLGAVREGGFMGHDLDFDCAYISACHDGVDAAAELRELAFSLIDHGYAVHADSASLHVRDAEHPDVAVKIFHLYFGKAGVLRFPFGVAGSSELHDQDWSGVVETDFVGARVLLPASREKLVETIYGSDWRASKPGFRWDTERIDRADSGLVPAAAIEEIYWADFYSRTTYTSGSTFFDLVASRDDVPGIAVDIGCGDGRDSFAFAGTGRTVTGLDRSHVGVRQAGRKAEQMGFADSLRFVACDVSEAEHLRSTLRSARGDDPDAPMLFYARFFLHSLPEDTQRTLMSVISECARPGDCFAAEFRTDRDEARTKIHGDHYRRFQNGAAFGRSLRDDYGFELVLEQEGNGMSPYKGEDPQLYRVIARHPG